MSDETCEHLAWEQNGPSRRCADCREYLPDAPAPLSINDCARGHRAQLNGAGVDWRVRCEDDDCWSGPWTDSPEEAVRLWNGGMK